MPFHSLRGLASIADDRYLSVMRTVAALLYDDMRAFDYGVIVEIWGVDRSDLEVPRFELRLCSAGARSVRLNPSAWVDATHDLSGFAGADLVIVPGRFEPFAPVEPDVIDTLRGAFASGTTIASLCSGAVVLASAGILEGRRAVTHWELSERLFDDYPGIVPERDMLFVEHNGVWTSAGTASGVDLCIELIRRAHGSRVANIVARCLIAGSHRTGDQAQFIKNPLPSSTGRKSIAGTLDWARGRIHQPLTVADLARHAGVTPRTFARNFVATTGTTPGQWLIQQRVFEAQRLLEATDLRIDQIAGRCGFGTSTMLRRHFTRVVGMAPSAYRGAFQRT
jgi:transcriptional regulator GlxA family with amidase domain